MKKILGSVTSNAGAFVIGLIVSMFLVPCAIGPYFVAGSLLSGLSLWAAMPWLVLYNLVFVLPMLIIALLIYLGFASIKNIEAWRQRNLRRLHLVAGIVLLVVGAGLVAGVFM
jgi:cytochrome c biogenesis protein CcdA